MTSRETQELKDIHYFFLFILVDVIVKAVNIVEYGIFVSRNIVEYGIFVAKE